MVDEGQQVICYAYQEGEANRELRMLKELADNREALQFHDVFPEIRDVVVCGCNELAYCFVKYLERQQIPVTVTGKYWDFFGYEECRKIDLDGSNKMIVYAEGSIPQTGNLYQTVIRRVSPEFECIDRIYEANVLAGKIQDTVGNLETLLERVRGKEIIVLGTDAKAQDTYDFLYGQGIDICCFAEWREGEKENIHRTLLGKPVVNIKEAVKSKGNTVFIDCNDKNSALGTEITDIFDYYGYERNKAFFLIRDYTDVPCTNLLHVLRGKKVFFAGDERLCTMLFEYLNDKEQGNIELTYVELSQCVMMKATDILCVMNPWFDLQTLNLEENPKSWYFRETLSKQGVVSYTDYFAQVQALVLVDRYRNRGRKKYEIKEMLPKGILLGRIPPAGGNVFFRGILDGHPAILKWGYNVLNNNLFLYCIRLAGEKAENILTVFKKICREEFAFRFEEEFCCWNKFEKSARVMLSSKESFTSQELFVIFHIAYEEMLCGFKITDLDQKIIYWEPHNLMRNHFPFFAQWLEDEQLTGQTAFIHRDNIVWSGSYYKFDRGKESAFAFVPGAQADEGIPDDIEYRYWKEFHMRLEDMKLHPERELRKLCRRCGIPWSETMLRTTIDGQAWEYDGIADFDLKPVFNKYEEFLSEFDRFRISLISSSYQKKYGYTYEECMKFSRKELQEMFLKEFRFQKELRFKREQDKAAYFLRIHKMFMERLWNVRRQVLMEDIVPEFEEVEIGKSRAKRLKQVEFVGREELDRLLGWIRQQERLILYGTGKDCKGILGHLDEEERERLLFSDLKAEYTEMLFLDKPVIAPRELIGKYSDYKVLVTSSQFHEAIQQRLEDMGVTKDRIICNKFQLWM